MTDYPSKVAVIEDDPKRPRKAIWSAASTFVGLFVAAWIADTDPFTLKEAGAALLGAGVGSGLIGGVTFAVRNPKRSRELGEITLVGVLVVVLVVAVIFVVTRAL